MDMPLPTRPGLHRPSQGIYARIVARLVAGQGRVVTDDALLAAAYGGDPDGGPDGAIACLRVVICRFRKTLPWGGLRRIRSQGYILTPEAAATIPLVDDRILVPASD